MGHVLTLVTTTNGRMARFPQVADPIRGARRRRSRSWVPVVPKPSSMGRTDHWQLMMVNQSWLLVDVEDNQQWGIYQEGVVSYWTAFVDVTCVHITLHH